MAGKKWRVEEEQYALQLKREGRSLPQCRQALENRFGGRWTLGQVEVRLHRLHAMADPLEQLWGGCDMYYLSVCVPWVEPKTRRWLDSLERQKSLPIPAGEDLDAHLDGLAVVVA
jgi:hypothetical protein